MFTIIEGEDVRLEAVLREPDENRPKAAAVVCHPHPLHGGTMNNKVVYRSGKAFLQAGLAVLRFNFRGVGASTGAYDDGKGEQQDVSAAIGFLEQKYGGLPIALAGFSFGSWVGLQVGCKDDRVSAMIGLGLPLASKDFDFLADNEKPTLLLVGDRDEFCPRDRMSKLEKRLPASTRLRWIEEADHFFAGKLEAVQEEIVIFCGDVAPSWRL